MKPENITETVVVSEPVAGQNHLFPAFLNLQNFSVLIVGGASAGLEKLQAILNNAPQTNIRIVSDNICVEIKRLAEGSSNIELIARAFDAEDLTDMDIVVVTISEKSAGKAIYAAAKDNGQLVYITGQPELCDFHFGEQVSKGDLKIAISTNGKAPEIAEYLKERLTEALPDTLEAIGENMHGIGAGIHLNFSNGKHHLNGATRVLDADKEVDFKTGEKKWRRIATALLFAFFFMFVGHLILSYLPLIEIWGGITGIASQLNHLFFWMILAGFLAQLVDGALGMGYGVVCATILLSLGINLPAISGSIHTAEMFSSGVSGYSHYKFGNVNKKLFKTMLIPGIIGAVAGAYLLSRYGDDYARYIRPFLAAYTLFLGARILLTAFKKNRKAKKVKRVGWLAGAGGFLDSFGGGGWGPLVTSTLISKGRTPRFVIGSVSITEFFVTLASAITFFSMLGISHWQVILGLIVGGMMGAPIAARLAGKLPLKTMFIAVGTMVVIWSLRVLILAL